MKRFNFCFFLMVFIWISYASAATWVVDNNPEAYNADFSSIQTAISESTAGDTLLIVGSENHYGTITLDRRLTILGPGYFLAQNGYDQISYLEANVLGVYFSTTGAEYSYISGLRIRNVIIPTTGITITRNYIYTSSNLHSVSITSTGADNIICQNYIVQTHEHTDYHIFHLDGCNNTRIENNFLYSHNDVCDAIWCTSNSTGTEVHFNVIKGDLSLYYTNFSSNILRSGTYTNNASTNRVYNNIANGTQFGSANGNVENISMDNVFISGGSADSFWMLSDGSPAIGAGHNGEDCGMYGGPNPYILSGLPNLPAITSFTAPDTAATSAGLQVEIEAGVRE